MYGAFGGFFKLFGKTASIDFRAKELYVSNPEQQGTLITFTFRTSLIKGLFAGIGGAHGHQVPFSEFKVNPVSSIGGFNSYILHTSGFNVELGYSFKSLLKNTNFGIYPTIHLAYTHLFAANYSLPNFTLNAGFRIGIKQFN